MKKILIGMLMFVFITGTALAGEMKTYRNIVKHFIPPNMEFSIKKTNKEQIKGYDTLKVSIKNKTTGTVINSYIWVSHNKKRVIPVVLKMKDGKLYRVLPKNSIEHVAVDVSWFTKFIKKFPKSINKTYGNGKTVVYMFSDPYCPFCKREFKTLMSLAKENKITLHVLPLIIHGERSVQATLLFWHYEATGTLKQALDKIEAASFADVDKLVNENKKLINNQLKKKYNKHLRDLVILLMSHRINATPTMFVMEGDEKAVIIQGVNNLSKEIK